MKAAAMRRWWLHGRRPWVLVLAPTLGVIAALESHWVLAVLLLAVPVVVTVTGLAVGGACVQCGISPLPCDTCRARVVEDYL